jgi:predicted alpha/beta superfamily hydrolase
MKPRIALFLFSWLLAVALVGTNLGAQVPKGVSSGGDAGEPVTVPRARQYDLTSRINGQTYRLFISTPLNAQPNMAYPVVYVLDGNLIFGTAVDAVTLQPLLDQVAPAIVVGIGYPTDDVSKLIRLRAFDLIPSRQAAGQAGGGADAFFRVIEEELKPFVMGRHRVDPSKQIIYGCSLGGLAVLRNLFRNPTAFSTYIVASPSIWWNNREVLADEEAFSKRARAGELQLKVLITSAGDEQYRGDDPKLVAEAQRFRMVDNASELAARLAALNPQKITVVRMIFDGETHMGVTCRARP